MKKTTKRRPLKVDEDFQKLFRNLKFKKQVETGKELSDPDFSKQLIPLLQEYEKKMIKGDVTMQVRVKMDKRRGSFI